MLKLVHTDERGGVSIIAVVSLGAALTIILGALFMRSSSQLTAVGTDRSRQRSIQVADAGIDDAVARLDLSDDLDNYPYDPGVPEHASPEAERDWAIQAASAMPAARTQPAPHGQWVHIIPEPKPTDEADVYQRLIYSVGYIPTKAAPKQIRVIRSEYDFTSGFAMAGGILTDGDLPIGGNAAVVGPAGSVHANGDVSVSGSNATVGGSLTATDQCNGEITTGDGLGCQEEQPNRTVPTIVPRNHYHLSQFDLCPDGTVREGPANPSGNSAQTTPCSGDLLGKAPYNNWSWTTKKSTLCVASTAGCWSMSGNSQVDGVYYVYGAHALLQGGSSDLPIWRATVIAEASAVGAERSHCPHTGGDIYIAGNRRISAHPNGENLLAVAGRDLMFQGGAEGGRAYQGILASHEQFRMAGGGEVYGVVIGNDGCDSDPSLVRRSTSGSNGYGLWGGTRIEPNGDIDPPFAADSLRITRWLEL